MKMSLNIVTVPQYGHVARVTTSAQIIVEFEPTLDYNFLVDIYHVVFNLFSFICNRRNLALDYATISGNRVVQRPDKEERNHRVTSEIHVFNAYHDEPENENIQKKILNFYRLYGDNLALLVQMIADDQVHIYSIHSSRKARLLLDLKQCLNITACFEYYQRTFTPAISSDATIEVCDAVKRMITEYAQTLTGKRKGRAQSMADGIRPEVSLSQRICKVFNGYKSWRGLQTILPDISKERCMELSLVANKWRNELAHEKREYEPDFSVVDAIRAIEYINYCIILRTAGFTDESIRNIIDAMKEF